MLEVRDKFLPFQCFWSSARCPARRKSCRGQVCSCKPRTANPGNDFADTTLGIFGCISRHRSPTGPLRRCCRARAVLYRRPHAQTAAWASRLTSVIPTGHTTSITQTSLPWARHQPSKYRELLGQSHSHPSTRRSKALEPKLREALGLPARTNTPIATVQISPTRYSGTS